MPRRQELKRQQRLAGQDARVLQPRNENSSISVSAAHPGMSALGQKRTLESGSGMSALPPEADMFIVGINVC